MAEELAGISKRRSGGPSGFSRDFLFLEALYSLSLDLYSSRSASLSWRSSSWMGSMRFRQRVRRPLPADALAVMNVKRFGWIMRLS